MDTQVYQCTKGCHQNRDSLLEHRGAGGKAGWWRAQDAHSLPERTVPRRLTLPNTLLPMCGTPVMDITTKSRLSWPLPAGTGDSPDAHG